MSSNDDVPCPICFEKVTSSWPTQKAEYTAERNHSWHNGNRCDAHGICWACLAKHIEVQVLSEGKCSIRCPGEGCRYHLLLQDVNYALWDSHAKQQVLDTLAQVSNQSCQDRLKECVFGTVGGESADWVLRECQPCPQCFVLARRETGCNHIVCRCGCDFCFSCGAPNCGHEEAGCICGHLEHQSRDGQVFFAAWLRSAYATPCEWLREEDANDPTHRFVTTLGFWLWLAGAPISAPLAWDASTEECANQTALPPLKWNRLDYCCSESDRIPDDFLVEVLYGGDMQDFAGHLRKEVYSLESRRTVRRRGAQRRLEALTGDAESDKHCGFKKVAGCVKQQNSKAQRQQRSKVAGISRGTRLLGDEF